MLKRYDNNDNDSISIFFWVQYIKIIIFFWSTRLQKNLSFLYMSACSILMKKMIGKKRMVEGQTCSSTNFIFFVGLVVLLQTPEFTSAKQGYHIKWSSNVVLHMTGEVIGQPSHRKRWRKSVDLLYNGDWSCWLYIFWLSIFFYKGYFSVEENHVHTQTSVHQKELCN